MLEGNIDILQEMEPAQIFSMVGDNNVQDVMSRLKFISKIKRGEKINVKDLFVRDNDSILQRLLRSVKNYSTYISGSDIVESKEATLIFIKDTVNSSINLISMYRKNKEKFSQDIADLLVKNLEESKTGIHNSIGTYEADRKFMAHAEAIMQTLEARIKSLKDIGYMQGLTDTSLMPNNTMNNNVENNTMNNNVENIKKD
jgi:hypothetical protein